MPLQERNKPIEPPKKPAQAPFFLPTVPGLERDPVFDLQGADGADEGMSQRHSTLAYFIHAGSQGFA